MYKYTLRRISDNKEMDRVVVQEPIAQRELDRFDMPKGCFIDVCRLVDDPLSDTANFRDEVYYELEEL